MLTEQRLHTPGIRMIVGIYAAVIGLFGMIVTGWGPLWFGMNLPGLPFAKAALVRVFGSVLIAAGCWAATLANIDDPALRRKGLMWFAAGHFAILLVFHSQRMAIWSRGLAPRFEVALSLEFLVVLAIVGYGERLFMETARGERPVDPLRSRYEQQIREAGAQEERNRLARDLHDSIKQQIFVIQTAAATAQTRFEGDHSGAALAIDQIRNAARDAMTEMEVMMDQLRAVPLENASLIEALKKQCEALGHRTGAHVDFKPGALPPDGTLPPGAHQAILRVAQEACANIGRHARAINVVVSLASTDRSVELRIVDDGAGFDQLLTPGGMGIANMRSRAREFGGSFFLNSRPGGGTTVTFSVPRVPALPSGYRKQIMQHLLLIGAVGAGVVFYMPAGGQRKFAVLAWSLALTVQVVRYAFQWAEKD